MHRLLHSSGQLCTAVPGWVGKRRTGTDPSGHGAQGLPKFVQISTKSASPMLLWWTAVGGGPCSPHGCRMVMGSMRSTFGSSNPRGRGRAAPRDPIAGRDWFRGGVRGPGAWAGDAAATPWRESGGPRGGLGCGWGWGLAGMLPTAQKGLD